MPDEKLPIILHPGSGLALVKPQGGRIVAEMVSGAVELSRGAAAANEALVPRFRIGEYDFCEPDNRQILLWAQALGMEPETIIERLMTAPVEKWHTGKQTQFVNGRITQLYWNMKLLPVECFEWVEGLVIESVVFYAPDGHEPIDQRLSFPLREIRRLDCSSIGLVHLEISAAPKLTELWCYNNGLTSLELSSVPHLTELNCGINHLTSLNLSSVPQLTELCCYNNKLTILDLSAVPHLTELICDNNQLASLDISFVPQLCKLSCGGNRITSLDLSVVPQLNALHCLGNQLDKLDIRSLEFLQTLYFNAKKVQLIKRAGQSVENISH